VIEAIDTLTTTDSSAISIKSGCELLLRFITLTALDAGVTPAPSSPPPRHFNLSNAFFSDRRQHGPLQGAASPERPSVPGEVQRGPGPHSARGPQLDPQRLGTALSVISRVVRLVDYRLN